MEPITGKAASSIALACKPPSPPHTYFGVAQSLMPAMKTLADSQQCFALTFLAAHVLECLLKAYLSRNGSDKMVRQPPLRHNLNRLWAETSVQGLGISTSPPGWADCLSQLHNAPYYLRYSTAVNGLVLPAAEPMVSELEHILELVRGHI